LIEGRKYKDFGTISLGITLDWADCEQATSVLYIDPQLSFPPPSINTRLTGPA